MDNSPQERRIHFRVYRNFILGYYEKGTPVSSQKISQVNNVSKGGINFSASHPLKSGAELIIELKAPFILESIHLEGIVLGCKEKIPEVIYEIRVKFLEVSPAVGEVLEKIESYGRPGKSKRTGYGLS